MNCPIPIYVATWTRAGFSLVEMLVVISLITLIIAITMPAMSRARESGRDTQCKSNLRQIGMALTQYADSHATLCSGAWDWKYDGCITQTGWVADLVAQGVLPDQIRCPSNSRQMHEQFQTMLTLDPNANKCANALGSTATRVVDGVTTQNVCRLLATKPNPADRVDLLKRMVEDGYNSNYITTWLLVRSEVKLTDSGNLTGDVSGCPSSLLSRNSTVGPMNRARIGMSSLSSTIIPLVACAQMADAPNSVLTTDIGPYGSGSPLSAGMTGGPLDSVTMNVPLPGAGTGFSAWGPYWTRTVQDYRNFGPVHAGGACNVLFLDGNVASFTDDNHDGFLNSGFKASSRNQFVDDTVELPSARIYSGWTLQPSRMQNR